MKLRIEIKVNFHDNKQPRSQGLEKALGTRLENKGTCFNPGKIMARDNKYE